MTANKRPLENNTSDLARKRLWVVSEVYYPEETSTGYYLTAIAEGLADRFDVKVLCGQPNYSARGIRAPKHEFHNRTEIFRAAGTTLNRNVLAFRLINMLTLGLSVFFHGLQRFRRGDRVVVVTTPPSMPFIVGLASLFKGAIYTPLIHDCYPEGPIAVGMLKMGSLTARTIDFFNRWLYKHARKIIVVGRDMKELIDRKSDGLDACIEVIPNWAEIDDVRPTPRCDSRLLRDLGISEKLVISHAGNIGYPTEVKTLIEAIVKLKDDDRFHFVFIGSGVRKPELEKAIDENQLSNVTLLPPRPRSDQINFLNGCDIGLVSLIKGMWGAAMPSKTYNIMAAGKPVLALTEPGSELARVIDEEQIGWHLPPGDAERLVEILNNIYVERPQLDEMGQRARSAAEEKYSLSSAVDRYAAVLE